MVAVVHITYNFTPVSSNIKFCCILRAATLNCFGGHL